MGRGVATEKMMFDYLRGKNGKIGTKKLEYIVRTYVDECATEGVNHDVAFVQMCRETNFLKFGGTVSPGQNNFCGLGTVAHDVGGAGFSTIKDGIRAHVQHLHVYGSSAPLKNPCVDPRHKFVQPGRCKTVHDLVGTWATDHNYGRGLEKQLHDLLGR
jgi:hypothetical protein